MAHRLLLALLLLALGTLGCKGATNGKPPVDHPMYEHQPPDDIAEEEDEEEEEEVEEEEESAPVEDAQ